MQLKNVKNICQNVIGGSSVILKRHKQKNKLL